jgi:hypothetical protein
LCGNLFESQWLHLIHGWETGAKKGASLNEPKELAKQAKKNTKKRGTMYQTALPV